MKKLHNDISRCCNDECPLRETCLRWLDLQHGNEKYLSMAIFQPVDGKCEHKIESE